MQTVTQGADDVYCDDCYLPYTNRYTARLSVYGEGMWNKMAQVLIKNHNALPRAPKTIILCSINAQSMECNVFDAFRRNAGLPDGSEIYS